MRVTFRVFSGSERLGDLAQVARQLVVDRVDQVTVKIAPNGSSYTPALSAAQFSYQVRAFVVQSRNANVNLRIGQASLGAVPLQSGGAFAVVDTNVAASTLVYVNNPGASDAYIDILMVG